MISSFFHTILYVPLYNGLIFILNLIPGGDVGLAIIIFTIVIKFILFPLSAKSIQAQRRMKEIEPEIKAIQLKFKDDKQEQARQTMALYKAKQLNPFSGIFLILIQIPIIIALYRVFISGGLPIIDANLLYSFIDAPAKVSMNFLGLLDVANKSILLAFFAGITQYFQAKFMLPKIEKKEVTAENKNTPPSFKDEFMKGMNLQMQYFLPIFVFFIAWSVSGAVALYWVTSNVFSIAQELYVRRKNPIK